MSKVRITRLVLLLPLYVLIAGCSRNPADSSPTDDWTIGLNEWATGTPMPTARHLAAAGVIDGKLYVAGGWINQSVDMLEIYDPANDTWTTGASMLTPRFSTFSGVIDGKLYVGGGSNVGPGVYENLKTLEIYDPVSDSWIYGASTPIHHSGAVAEVVEWKLYVIGRYGVEAYDPDSDTWAERSPMLTPRSWTSSGMINGKIYIVGGYSASVTTNVLEVYNPASDTWSTGEPMPSERVCAAAEVIHGKLYVAGGELNDPAGIGFKKFDVLEVYGPISNSWVERTSLPTTRNRAVAEVIDDKLYVVGGDGWVELEGGGKYWSYVGTLHIYTP